MTTETAVPVTHQRPPGRPARTSLALGTLFFGMFVLGGAELLAVGVLELVAADLQVSVPAAGSLVTAYALGVAIGGPLLTALTIKLDRRTVLVGTLILFSAGTLVAVVTPSFGLVVAARGITGALYGLFVATAFAAAISVVPLERAGRAISVVISGVAVSAAFGVPLGTLVGQILGWRGSFTAVVVLAALAAVATATLVPPVPQGAAGTTNQARYAFAPRVLAVLGLSLVVFASLFAALTYVVPFLGEVTGISGALISAFLLAYGVATAVGSVAGGGFADRSATRTLIWAPAGAAVSLLALYLGGANAVVVAMALLAWGFFAWSMAPSLQYRVISLAGPGRALAQSLPASAINVGIALGSIIGGFALDRFGASAAVVAGLVIVVVAIPVAIATSFLAPPLADGQPATDRGTGEQ